MGSSSSSLSSESFLSSLQSSPDTQKGLAFTFLHIDMFLPHALSEIVESKQLNAYSISRSVIQSALNSLANCSKEGEGLNKIVKGDIRNRLIADVGKDAYKSIKKVTLQRIYYQQVGICQLKEADNIIKELLRDKPMDANSKSVRYLLNHNSLVLEVHCIGRDDIKPLYIRAEKVGALENHAGIIIREATKFNKANKSIIVRCLECNGVQFDNLEVIEDILEKYRPLDYSPKNSCCWHYALDTYKELIEACMKRCSENQEKVCMFQKELKDIEEHLSDKLCEDIDEAIKKILKWFEQNLGGKIR